MSNDLKILPIEDVKVWEDFLKTRGEANFLQSWYWGEFHEALGGKAYRVGFVDGEEIVGVMLALVENAKRGKYLTVPAGPIIDFQNEGLVKLFLDEIKRIAKVEGCVFIRIRPQLLDNDFSRNLFQRLGFKDAPMHLHAELTNQLDISKSEDELLSQMRKTTRYEIKKAINLKVKVEISEDPELIKGFYNIQLETAKRQGFIPFSYQFLLEQFKIFVKDGNALLFSAYIDKKLLAQAFIIFYGREAVYHYGVSTKEGRNYPGAYLIQWEAIKEAKRRGKTLYNFWGVAPEDNSTHRFYKISIFKRGFGGEDLKYLHAQDLPINPLRYVLNYAVETLRKKSRGL